MRLDTVKIPVLMGIPPKQYRSEGGRILNFERAKTAVLRGSDVLPGLRDVIFS